MRALFLDRDGVINIDYGYVGSRERFDFFPGIFELTRAAKARGLAIFIVTNQAGIARGLFTEDDFACLMKWVLGEFAQAGTPITGCYHCPHHPDFGLDHLRIRCDCRKPQPGLLLRASREHDVDMAGSVMVGDKEGDMLAGHAAGVGTLILLGGAQTDPRWKNAASLEEVAAMLGNLETGS